MSILKAISACIQARDKYKDLDGKTVGSFCTSCTLPLSSLQSIPLINVNGVGHLAFPLLPSQCADLIHVAQQAPFGRGEQTIVDVKVRNTWQIDGSAVQLDSAFLDTVHRQVVPQVCTSLGLNLSAAAAASHNDVEARLYKLLVYEVGGFFRSHRDSEKEAGMFGTLVILLPSAYEGGELVVEHAGQQRIINCNEGEQWRCFSYAAFFADCKHEIKPVTSGYRVALTFNLCKRQAAGKQPLTQQTDSASRMKQKKEDGEDGIKEDSERKDENNENDERGEQASAIASSLSSTSRSASPLLSAASLSETPTIVRELASALIRWCIQVAAPSSKSEPIPVVVELEHEYTKGGLSRRHLKNYDRLLMTLIDKANAFTKSNELWQQQQQQQSSSATSSPPQPSVIPLLCLYDVARHGYDDCGEDEYSIDIEVTHIALPEPSCASHSTSALFSSLVTRCTPSIDDSYVLHTNANFNWANVVPDDEEEEHTGNEGTNIDKFYHRAGILLLPRVAMWSFITAQMQAGVLVTELQAAASATSSINLHESVQLALALHPCLTSATYLYPSFLNVLSCLNDRVVQQGEDNDTASTLHAIQLSSLMDGVLTECEIDFSDVSAPTQFDKLASARGMDRLRPSLVLAFQRRLTESHGSAQTTPLSLLQAAQFLLRLFLLPPASSSPQSQPSSASLAVSAAPAYDGSARSIRAICDHMLSSSEQHSTFTFPFTLDKDERHQVHMIADEVGQGKLRHESTGWSNNRVLTVTRMRKPSAAVTEGWQTMADPLTAMMAGLPRSADGAHLPARWVQTASEMCQALCGELETDKLQRWLTSQDMSTLFNTVIAVLLLFAVYQAQRSSDAAQQAEYTVELNPVAGGLCQHTCRCIEREWSKTPADKDVLECMDDKLIKPLLPLLELITSQVSVSDNDTTKDESPSPLLAAILSLPQRVLSWLHAQLSSLPSPPATSWAYETKVSSLFRRPESHFSWVDAGRRFCGCALCKQLQHFLKSATEKQCDFRLKERDRRHIGERIAALHNQHIEYQTITSGSPYTLHVVKRTTLAALWDKRRAALQALIKRVDTAVADMLAKQAEASSALAPSSVSASAFVPSSQSSPSSPSRPPLLPLASQSRRRKGKVAARGRKRKHDAVELHESEEE